MHFAVVFKTLGILLVLFSSTLLPPVVVSWWYGDGAGTAFIHAFVIALVTGSVLWLVTHRNKRDMRFRDGFMVVVLFWTVLAFFGALPLYLAPDPALTFTGAFFESMSGLTTTGATVIKGLDELPRSVLYYRQQLQWLGGMGINEARLPQYQPSSRVEKRNHQKDSVKTTTPPAGMRSQKVPAPREK